VEYCLAGGLQSTLDEYAHVLLESEGLVGKSPDKIAAALVEAMTGALALRAVTLSVDDIRLEPSAARITLESRRMRARFALRLGEDQVDDSEEANRTDSVRRAFNSPFWPFVLATTSVGQEGLDFHPYCHAVVHWNLPSNPVDLEQREGRVHRYKGHAVRRNLATQLGRRLDCPDGSDPWAVLFETARLERSETASDLVPFWVYPIPGGAKIERHVPAFPLSRDLERLIALRRSLAVYRMVFGQPRQEDLMQYLLAHFTREQLTGLVTELRIDLSPPRSGA
jgi:hypothetical protein